MARTTGPILTVGAITWTNRAILSDKGLGEDAVPFTAQVAVGTGIAAMLLAGLERVSSDVALGVSYLALVAILFTRIGGQPAPMENLAQWWQQQ